MKDLLINSIINKIKVYKDYNDGKVEIIKYGLTSLYLIITKGVVIFTLGYFLGIINTLLKLMFFYTIIRLTAFGVHAKRSIDCWIASLLVFTILPYLSETVVINTIIKLPISIIMLILLAIYAPADTEKRPLIHKKKRIIYKIITIINSVIYILLIFFIKDFVLSNCIFYGLITATIVVLPITYKLFKTDYNNYKNYIRKEN